MFDYKSFLWTVEKSSKWQRKDGSWWTHDPETDRIVPAKSPKPRKGKKELHSTSSQDLSSYVPSPKKLDKLVKDFYEDPPDTFKRSPVKALIDPDEQELKNLSGFGNFHYIDACLGLLQKGYKLDERALKALRMTDVSRNLVKNSYLRKHLPPVDMPEDADAPAEEIAGFGDKHLDNSEIPDTVERLKSDHDAAEEMRSYDEDTLRRIFQYRNGALLTHYASTYNRNNQHEAAILSYMPADVAVDFFDTNMNHLKQVSEDYIKTTGEYKNSLAIMESHPDPRVRSHIRNGLQELGVTVNTAEGIENYTEWCYTVIPMWVAGAAEMGSKARAAKDLLYSASKRIGPNAGKAEFYTPTHGRPMVPDKRFQKFTERLYQETQAMIDDDTVKLYRGVDNPVVTPSPMESWTTDKDIATMFAGGTDSPNRDAYIEEVNAPKESILFSMTTQLGDWDADFASEREYVVLGYGARSDKSLLTEQLRQA